MIYDPCVILCPERLTIPDTARIDSFVKIEAAGGVFVGEYVHIASFCHIGIGGGAVELGDYSAYASGTKIISGSNDPEYLSASAVAPSDMQSITRRKITVGKYAVCFANSVILANVGEGAVIGAGAVLTHDAMPWGVYVGVPARWVKMRSVVRATH